MKLIIATLTAATVLASTATAMVAPANSDPRDVAQNTLGQITTGASSTVPADAFFLDGRSKALNGTDSVKITTFEANERPLDATDIR